MRTLEEFIKKDCSGNVSEAARVLGTSYVTVKRWLSGKASPSRAWLMLMEEKGIKEKKP